MSEHFPSTIPAAAAAWAALLDTSHDLLALLDAQGRIVWANASFERESGHAADALRGQQVMQLMAIEAASATFADCSARPGTPSPASQRLDCTWRHRDGTRRHGRLRRSAWPEPAPASGVDRTGAVDGIDGVRELFALQDCTELCTLRAEAQQRGELLDMAQEFGRVGVWSRDLPSHRGHWDRHMFEFYGLPLQAEAPPFGDVLVRVHPEDHGSVGYLESTQRIGAYSTRFRILQPDGQVRHVHSHWEVRGDAAGVPDRAIGMVVDDTEIYRLAEALHRADEALKLALELGRIGTWRHDLRQDRYFYSDSALRILGLTPRPEGLSPAEVHALIHPDDLPKVLANAQTARQAEAPVDTEARYRHADGRWLHLLMRSVVHRDDRGEPVEFIGVGLDISAQVDQLREASERARRLENAASSAGVGIWGRNPKTGQTEWNDQMFRITGRSPQDGGPSREEWLRTIVHPDDRAGVRAAFEASIDDYAIHEHECRIIRPDGEVRWITSRARREIRDGQASLFGATLDVTERVRTEAALRSATERVVLAARSAGVGTWEWNLDTGAVVWDEAMFRLRGLEPRPEALDADARMAIVHPDDRSMLREILKTSLRHPHGTAHEFRITWPDGSVHWLASRSNVAPDEAGQPRRRIGVNWDVTEARNAEASRHERELALRESQAKTEFLSRMSHELRTPLNAVLGFAQLLQMDGQNLQADQRSKISHIQSAGAHLLSLIDDVLDLSSLASNQLKLDLRPVPLAEVLREALPLVEAQARAAGITLQVEAMDASVRADRIRLRQVAINLLSNAIKYNRPQGRVQVSCRPIGRGDRIVLEVSDTGRGMSREQLAHLFEPFNRLGIESEGIAGTGIGLAVVKALVEHMEGTVQAHSEPGIGSRFEVTLPRAWPQPSERAPSSQPPPPASAGPHPPKRAGQLLYIEDNPVNVLLLEELVRSQIGIAIRSAPTGQAGLDLARALQPDLVLVDIQLPDFDGFEVLRRLRAQPETAGIPCIALSANAMPEDIARAREAGFADYWTKPIDFSAFLTSMNRLFPKA